MTQCDWLIDETSEAVLTALAGELQPGAQPLAAFIGAGVSRQGGLPLWRELITQMDEAVERIQPRPPHVRKAVLSHSDMLWQAEIFRLELERKSKYDGFIRNAFRTRLTKRNPVIASLVALPFRHFITTNYDSFLEQSLETDGLDFEEFDWDNRRECRDFLFRYLSVTKPAVIHIHGKHDQPDNIVLTHRDYVARYVDSADHVQKLAILFTTMRIVFIGFSLDDPDLKYVLRQVNSKFGTGDVQHYAILGMARGDDGMAVVERERLERQFGISPIFYDDENGHAALGDVLRALAPDPAPLAATSAAPAAGDGIPLADPPAAPAPVRSTAQLRAMAESTGDGAPPVIDWNSDPNKGKFGGSAVNEAGTRELRVLHWEQADAVYSIDLVVVSTSGMPLAGTVTFHLHPTFARTVVSVDALDGVAELRIRAYGAFTVGVECADDGTLLELDLAAVTKLPKEFRES